MLVFEGRFLTQASRSLQANFILTENHQGPLDRDVSRYHG